MSRYVIQEKTLQGLGDLVRASNNHGDKVPVKDLQNELAQLIGTASLGRAKPNYSINFAYASENPTEDFELSTTLKNNISWSDNTRDGYITFTANGADPYVVIGGINNDSPLTYKGAQDLAYIVIKYRVNSPITDAKVYGEFYTSRTDGISWNSPFGNHVDWQWVCDGEWHLAFVDARYVWGSAENIYLYSFRFDALAAGKNPDDVDFSGFTIDIEYINFFAEKYYAETFIQTEKYISNAITGENVNTSFVYNKNERYYTGSENIAIKKYMWAKYPDDLGYYPPSAPQTSADGISAIVNGQEVVLCDSLGADYIRQNNGISDTNGNYQQIIFKGWVDPISTGLTIEAFAYTINNDQIINMYEDSAWAEEDTELSSILGSSSVRRHNIVVDTSSLGEFGMYSIVLYVKLSDGKFYQMGTWPAVTYRRKTDYIDAEGNAYRVASSKVYKNGEVIDAIKATAAGTSDGDWSAFIAYNPQIEVFQKTVGDNSWSADYVYPDTIIIKTYPPATSHEEPEQETIIIPLEASNPGIYTPPEGVTGYAPVTITNNTVKQIVEKTLTKVDDAVLANVTSIGYGIFASNAMLQSVSIPEGVYSIGYEAFARNYSLKTIYLPSSLMNMEALAFTDCASLEQISIAEGSRFYLLDGCIIDKSLGSYHTVFLGCKSSTIPTNPLITHIGMNAFTTKSITNSIVIPDNIVNIGDSAFASCKALTQVEIGTGLVNLGNDVFGRCDNLTTLTLRCTTPPVLQYEWGLNLPVNCSVYVPAASLETYKTAFGWSTVADRIFAIEETEYEVQENENGVTYNILSNDYTVEENDSGGNTVTV